MPIVEANGIRLNYESLGPESAEPLILIHGVGAQLIGWPDELCRRLVEEGLRVIRFDNRDVGLSTHIQNAPPPDLAAALAARREGRAPDLPYHLADLVEDAVGLMDALDIPRAHLLGASLGGMIAQQFAIDHPSRVLSLAIIMSQAGNEDLPPSNPDALAILSTPAPDPSSDEEAYVSHAIKLNRILGSPKYPAPEAELRDKAICAMKRAYNPPGALRQLAAGRTSPDRSERLRRLDVPTLVIHGSDDPLISPEGGRHIAEAIDKSLFLLIDGMGHDLPAPLFDLFASAVGANARRGWRL